MRFAIPRIGLIGPVEWLARRVFAQSVATCPASPRRPFRIVHARGDEVEKCSGVAFLLRVRGVDRIERAERTVAGEHVALEIESTGTRGDCGELMVPTFAGHRRLERVHPKLPARRARGVIAKDVAMTNDAQTIFERGI